MSNNNDSSSQSQNTLGLIAALMHKPELRDVWYNNKEVKLDGFRFVSCRFDNCRLVVTSSNFELEHCFLDSGTVVTYGSEIIKPIRLFTSRYEWFYENMPYFAPTRHEDGTITIKG